MTFAEPLLTPSKITAWLDCAHYLTLRSALDAGQIERPDSTFSAFAQLLADKGLQHEQDCLAAYRTAGKNVLEVSGRQPGETFAAWVARVGNPLAGDYDVIYQMPFAHNGMRGIADFLERTDDGSYEPVDAKLARTDAKPGHVLQLCFYADAIAALTGATPARMHLWLGSGAREGLRVKDFDAYWHRLRHRLAGVLAAGPAADTVPQPNPHCDFCEFRDVCERRWHDEQALHLTAGIRASETEVLATAGVPDLPGLAARRTPVDGLRAPRLQRLVGQAGLQVQARPDGPPPFAVIPAGEDAVWGHGFDALPAPDSGDVFLDLEGHPFFTARAGLFFLFGVLARDDDGAWAYRAFWAHDAAEEARAVAALVEHLTARRRRFPDMHVYHYNHTERSALVALAERHGVAERAMAGLIESGAFVDLLPVVRNAIQVGAESYGLKTVEKLAGFRRSAGIERGAGAVLHYERFMDNRDPAELVQIAAYNEDDVRATLALRDWLVGQRPDDLAWRDAVLTPDADAPQIDEREAELHAFAPGSAEHLLGDLLGYWRREWLAYLGPKAAKLAGDPVELFDDPEALAGLQVVGEVERVGANGRRLKPGMRFRFPPQALDRFPREGGAVMFAGADGARVYATIDDLDREAGTLDLLWGTKAAEAGVLPSVVLLHDWVSTKTKAAALADFAQDVLDGTDPNPVTLALLRGDPPRFTADGGPAGEVFSDHLSDMQAWVVALDGSWAAIQGPPGAGKTYSAARLIHALIRAGKRVGVTATSHHAIDNVLAGVVKHFGERGDSALLQAVRKPAAGSTHRIDGVEYQQDNKSCAQASYNLVAGTTWLFCSDAMRDAPVDVLLIDEAGQLALADALAASGAARNVVLLGDPLQLPQVAQASHPGGSGASVLEHILAGEETMPPERGVFLATSYRMHPDVCDFISAEIYDGRLHSAPDCARQTTAAGTGLRWLRAEHTGNTTSSVVEAELIAAEITALLGTDWTDHAGRTAVLGAADFMVVAPYNDQVRLLRGHLDAAAATAGVEVGTVDKFQGREAAVVFFSMATSTGEDAPRGADFLFSRNRLNVAISRARCLAYLVCTDELLDTRARTVTDMRLLSTLNAVVSYATR